MDVPIRELSEWVQPVRELADEITLMPEAGELRVDIKGNLAAILAIASNKNPAGDSFDGRAQVKLVAGVRFEPTVFEL